MTDKGNFDYFLDQMLDSAILEFKATEQYERLREKLERMDGDCASMLASSERDFVTECFELISDADACEEQYVYRQGLLDCVKILKWLGVLA